MNKELNSVQKFYKDKTIFITGGSGFMGKVLIEKLLYSCSDVKELIVLMRPKRGRNGRQRVDEFTKLELFKRIKTEKPEVLRKIFPVYGEITQPNLGLIDEHLRYIIENTNIVIHLAASLKLEYTLKPNIIINLTGTKNVVDVSKQIKNLIMFVHTSTAFCNVEQETVEEKVYDYPHRPLDIIRAAEWMHEDSMAKIQKDMLGVHPNTYTYTKRLAEILVRDEFSKNGLPACIVRPSIVTPSYWEPVLGWVDSLNGTPGIGIATGKGVLRSLLVNPNARMQAIPVDMAVNGLLMFVKTLCTSPEIPKEIPVCHITTHDSSVMTYGELAEALEGIERDYPFSQVLWYPNCVRTTSKIYHTICTFLFQWIPAYFIDFFLWIFRQPRFMVRVQKKIATGMDVLSFFTMNDWHFVSDNFFKMVETQTNDEWQMFLIDSRNVGNNDKYMRNCVIGGRVYCAKDPESTLPRAKVINKILYVVDRICKFIFFYFLIRTILKYTGVLDQINEFLHTKVSSQVNLH